NTSPSLDRYVEEATDRCQTLTSLQTIIVSDRLRPSVRLSSVRQIGHAVSRYETILSALRIAIYPVDRTDVESDSVTDLVRDLDTTMRLTESILSNPALSSET